MWLEVDGKRVLQVRRFRWKFRGSEQVEVEGGAQVKLSWDLHNWLFQSKDDALAAVTAAAELGHAVFVFQLDEVEKIGEGDGTALERRRKGDGAGDVERKEKGSLGKKKQGEGAIE